MNMIKFDEKNNPPSAFAPRRAVFSSHGFTLVEIVLAIAIASILGMAMMKIFGANTNLFRGEKTVSRTYTNARLVMDEITRSVRMVNYNPKETTGAVFGVKQCAGSIGSSFTNTALSPGIQTSLYFTRDYNENSTLNYDSNDMVGYKFNSATTGACPDPGLGTAPCPNTIMVATIDPIAGNISGWKAKFRNVTAFQVDYQYPDGKWAVGDGVGSPDPSSVSHAFDQISAISIMLTMQSEKPHELTRSYITETINSNIMIRNEYYY